MNTDLGRGGGVEGLPVTSYPISIARFHSFGDARHRLIEMQAEIGELSTHTNLRISLLSGRYSIFCDPEDMARLFDHEVLEYGGDQPQTAPHIPGHIYLARRSTPEEAIAVAEHWLRNNLCARPIVGIDYAKHTEEEEEEASCDDLSSFDECDWELQDREYWKWSGVHSRGVSWEPTMPRPPVIQFRDDFAYPYQLNAGDEESTWLVHVDNQFTYDQFGRFFVDIRDYYLDACGMGITNGLSVRGLASEFLDDFYTLTPDSPDTELRPCVEYLDNFDGRARVFVPLNRYRKYEIRAHEQRSIIFSR